MLGDHLKTKMILFGIAKDPDTLKCLMTAGEKGVDIESRVVGETALSADSQDFRSMSPFGTTPCLKDVDFILCGTTTIMSYLNDKGFGPSLIPRNGVARAIQYQWSEMAKEHAAPHVAKLLSGEADDTTDAALAALFDALDAQLKNNRYRGDFIVGDFSLADIHWAPYAHCCEIAGKGELISARGAMKTWWEKVKVHKSTSKENYLAYNVLPTMDEIRANQLRSVTINV
ncbi:MAG: glutathione S-transferase family protein [Candidatus Thiodiazotropha sp. (ex Codakia rugifera)]|nr:glutathione S-transferase family protein [Candidatus Thiodiazotropha sp. (ex Codakia rugifera)]